MFSLQVFSPSLWVASLWSLLILLYSNVSVCCNCTAQFCIFPLCSWDLVWKFCGVLFVWELFSYGFIAIEFLVISKMFPWLYKIMFKGQSLCTNVTILKIDFTFFQPSINSWVSNIWWQHIRQVYYNASNQCVASEKTWYICFIDWFYHNYKDSTEVYFEFS